MQDVNEVYRRLECQKRSKIEGDVITSYRAPVVRTPNFKRHLSGKSNYRRMMQDVNIVYHGLERQKRGKIEGEVITSYCAPVVRTPNFKRHLSGKSSHRRLIQNIIEVYRRLERQKRSKIEGDVVTSYRAPVVRMPNFNCSTRVVGKGQLHPCHRYPRLAPDVIIQNFSCNFVKSYFYLTHQPGCVHIDDHVYS